MWCAGAVAFLVATLASDALAADPVALLAAYDRARVPLVADRLADTRAAAEAIAKVPEVPDPVATAAHGVGAAEDLDAARLAFGELSKQLVLVYSRDGTLPAGTRVYFCWMTPAYPYWLQPTPGIANPYMGTSMPRCGEGASFAAAVKGATPRRDP